MKNDTVNIFIVGGLSARGVYSTLSKKYKHVYYFKDEVGYSQQFQLLPQILILEESDTSLGILNQIKLHTHVNAIYLSDKRGFRHAFMMIKRGVADYILKDTFLNFSIQQSVNKAMELSENISCTSTKKLFFDSCALKKRYPFRFKLAKFLCF